MSVNPAFFTTLSNLQCPSFRKRPLKLFEGNVDLDLPIMPAPRKRSSDHIAEHTVDDPVPLVDEKKLDDTLQLLEDVLYKKQVQVDRCIRELQRAKEKLILVEKSASLAFPRDLERNTKVKSKMARMLLLSHCVVYKRVANSLNYLSVDEYRDPETRHPYLLWWI